MKNKKPMGGRGPMGGPMMPGEKPKNFKKSFGMLLNYLGQFKIHIVIVLSLIHIWALAMPASLPMCRLKIIICRMKRNGRFSVLCLSNAAGWI